MVSSHKKIKILSFLSPHSEIKYFCAYNSVQFNNLPLASPEVLPFLQCGIKYEKFSSVQLLSRVQLFATPWTVARQACLSKPTPGTCSNSAHWVSDAWPYPLWSPFPPTLNLSQHQGLFQWISSSHQVAKVLELKHQHQSFQWIFRTDFL